jgi:alkylation response protein AidB-like acyl-CoA dehydrogenase
MGVVTKDFDLFAVREEHELLRESVRALVETKIAPYAAAVDAEARYPQEAHDALHAADMHAIHIPEQYGGAGADALATCIVIEEVARACMSSSLIPAVNKLGTMPLILAASEELKQKYLRPLAEGRAMFSYALSEPDAGSDAGGMTTRAVPDGDGWRINGVKRWITNAGVSEYYTVMAVTEPGIGTRGISAFVLERSDAGFTFGAPEKKLGIKGSPTRELYFAAQAVGVAQGALDYATEYVKQRKQFGKPIADHQGVQFMLADMGMKLVAARQLTYTAAAKSERDEPDLTFYGAAAKCFASDAAMEITTDAVQLLGGYGYTQDYPLERMMRDAKITQIYEGTNQIQRVVMAKQLLKG